MHSTRMHLSCLLFILTLLLSWAHALNKTFTLTALNPAYPLIHNQPIVRSYPSDPSTIGVGFAAPYATQLTAFIYKNKLYRYCNTSPTGVCIGFYQKNNGGTTTELRLSFWSNENFPASSPCCSESGSWSVKTVGGAGLLVSSGVETYQLCNYAGGYSIEESGVGTCIYGTKISVSYNY